MHKYFLIILSFIFLEEILSAKGIPVNVFEPKVDQLIDENFLTRENLIKIKIIPHKRKCLWIQRRDNLHEKKYCKETQEFARLSDLDDDGRLTWRVKTSEIPNQTFDVVWESKFKRMFYVEPLLSKEQAEADKFGVDQTALDYVVSCTKLFDKARKVLIKTLFNKMFEVTLPLKDNLVTALKDSDPKPSAEPRWKFLMGQPLKYSASGEIIYLQGEGSQKTDRSQCHYSFKKTRSGINSGWIECVNLLNYEYLYLPAFCMNTFSEQK